MSGSIIHNPEQDEFAYKQRKADALCLELVRRLSAKKADSSELDEVRAWAYNREIFRLECKKADLDAVDAQAAQLKKNEAESRRIPTNNEWVDRMVSIRRRNKK
ncbi:MAG: hypothetical protein EOM80_16845 [Erysipelotrichia bacterium]|nr:hypothetical protein [Erysipelotrichia bacterium]